MEFWDKLKQQILSFKKVGDEVDLSWMKIQEGGRINGECPLCYEPSEEEIEKIIEGGILQTFKDEDLCLKHLTDMQS